VHWWSRINNDPIIIGEAASQGGCVAIQVRVYLAFYRHHRGNNVISNIQDFEMYFWHGF
jgi:hypothetical protein